MVKVDIAEWILSMTTTSDRAAATAGDLMQQSNARGNLWFWSNVLKTTASLVWRAWAAEPLYLTGLALRAFLLQSAFVIAMSVGVGLIFVAMWLGGLGPEVDSSADPVGFTFYYTGWGAWPVLIGCFSFFICQYCLGKWLARRAPHREWAAFLSFLIVNRVLWIIFSLWLSLPVSMDTPGQVLFVGIEFIALFAGIERGRRLLKEF